MSASDALVFPSYQEGSPNIVKQAMACNLPIVATEVGDVKEIISDTRKCHICPPDAAQFARKLAEVVSSPERTNGREHVQHLAGPIVAHRLIRIYEETLGTRAKQLDVAAQGGG
jgi:glycosyltransferase involved in cell wall biosynthesis